MTTAKNLSTVVGHEGFNTLARTHYGHMGGCPQRIRGGLMCLHFEVAVSFGAKTAWWRSNGIGTCVAQAALFCRAVADGATVRWCDSCKGQHLGDGGLCSICSNIPNARATYPHSATSSEISVNDPTTAKEHRLLISMRGRARTPA